MGNKFVKSSGGDNGNAGTSESLAWATLEYAADNLTPGDTLHLCQVGTTKFTIPSTGLLIDHDIDGDDLATVWTGASSTGVVDGTIAVIDGNSTTGHAISVLVGDSGTEIGDESQYIFQNTRIVDAQEDAWRIGTYDDDGGGPWYKSKDIIFINCHSHNADVNGFYGATGDSQDFNPSCVHFINCTATNNGNDGFKMEGVGIHYYACWADNNSGNGFVSNGIEGSATGLSSTNNLNVADSTYSHCIASNNSSTGFKYFRSLINCVAYSNNADGCRTSREYTYNTRGQNGIFPVINCIFDDNTGYGINNSVNADSQPVASIHNAFYSNSSGEINSSTKTAVDINEIILSASPFVNASGNDFRLNNIAGAGRKCRNNAYPRGTLLDGTHTNWKDIGAIPSKKPKIATMS